MFWTRVVDEVMGVSSRVEDITYIETEYRLFGVHVTTAHVVSALRHSLWLEFQCKWRRIYNPCMYTCMCSIDLTNNKPVF